MSITDPTVIDFYVIPKQNPDTILLVITDHLEWGDKAEQGEHLLMLQDKLNIYIAFIESGEIYTEIPGALGKSPIIRVTALYELPEQGEYFYNRVTEVLYEVGIGLEFELSDY
ncbi:DUF6572 domain-containing protein [Pseudomonas purpurea]|uniref:DUF6572 domain-containing protein n=1 Tax=Pseudomonas purpurea TaxID=3136737 RepID=UPI003266AE94